MHRKREKGRYRQGFKKIHEKTHALTAIKIHFKDNCYGCFGCFFRSFYFFTILSFYYFSHPKVRHSCDLDVIELATSQSVLSCGVWLHNSRSSKVIWLLEGTQIYSEVNTKGGKVELRELLRKVASSQSNHLYVIPVSMFKLLRMGFSRICNKMH